jgi:hypothetical protein
MAQFGSDLVIPKDIKPLFLSSVNRLIYLNMSWEFYKELFYNKDNNKLLTQTAYHFFNSLSRVFWHDITLGICQLADKPEYVTVTGKKRETLCLEMLVNRCEVNQTIIDSFQEFRKESESFSKLRNRVIAHLSLNTFLGREHLPKIDENKIQKTLELAGDVVQGISMQYGNKQQLSFKPLVTRGADELIFLLKEGKASCERKRKAPRKGHIPEGL